MVTVGETFYAPDRASWREWLEKNHSKKKEIFLIFYKKGSGKPRVEYMDAVREALCFGWIDSVVKPRDEESYCQRFSPRKKGSKVSELNLVHAEKLFREGHMKKEGLEALGEDKDRVLHAHRKKEASPQLSKDVESALKEDPEVWKHYQKFPKAYQRIRMAWIEGAREKPPIMKQRLAYFIKMTKKNKRYGMLEKE